MTEKGRSDELEVARITGIQGIRAACAALARDGEGAEGAGRGAGAGADAEGVGADGDASWVTETVSAPQQRKTCAVCAADNDGAREVCWNCGASLRRVR